jgi:hypothetical protein
MKMRDRFWQKPLIFLLSLLISIGLWLHHSASVYAASLRSGWITMPLLAQLPTDTNFVTAAVEAAGPAVVQVNVSQTLGNEVGLVL